MSKCNVELIKIKGKLPKLMFDGDFDTIKSIVDTLTERGEVIIEFNDTVNERIFIYHIIGEYTEFEIKHIRS